MNIGIILTSHGKLASGLLSTVEMIAGKFTNIEVVEFLEDDNYEDLDKLFLAAYDNLKSCDYILLIADLLGATPFNRAFLSLNDKGNVRFLVGANFNLIYYALTDSGDNIEKFIENLLQKSKDSILEYK